MPFTSEQQQMINEGALQAVKSMGVNVPDTSRKDEDSLEEPPKDASLVIPEGQQMNIDGKYGPADEDTFKYGTIEALNAARKEQALPELTKEDIEKLNTPAAGDEGAAGQSGDAASEEAATGGRRRTKRKQQKKGKSAKKGGKKHRKSSGKKSRRSSSKKSRRHGRK